MKYLVLASLFFASIAVKAQTNTFPSSGNVGIGTTSPSGLLHVVGLNGNAWSYFAGNINGAGNPQNITGLALGWNKSGGAGESIITYNTSAGGNPRLDFASFNGTTFSTEMTLLGGKLGIGTNSPYSWSRLHIKAPGANPWGIMSESSAGDKVIAMGHDGTNGVIAVSYLSSAGFSPLQLTTSNLPRLTIDVAGNVGIGIAQPSTRLAIAGALSVEETVLNVSNLSDQDFQVKLSGGGSSVKRTIIGPSAANRFSLGVGVGANNEYLTIINSGNVGIGTTSPDQKLTVNGIVHAKEVRVDLSVPGPDYVFANNYPLQTLNEVETYIDQNKHLPEVPSAKEMEKDGIQLGEMNMLLLKKIEKLTLYSIAANKRLDKLEQENKELRTIIKTRK